MTRADALASWQRFQGFPPPPERTPLRLVWFRTGYACGALLVDATGVIRDSCPIYRKLQGQTLESVKRSRSFVACEEI